MFVFFQNIVANFRWLDFVDIGIVSVLFYFLARWAVETTSRYLLLGMLSVLAVYVLGRSFDLYLTTLIFNGIATVLTFAVIVIFQDEIRRLLERLARFGSRRGSGETLVGDSELVDLIKSVAWMANHKVGALIVFAGADPLDRLIEGGVSLGGKISKSLLISLFDPHTPGHDGATVIKDQRIEKFAAHLPLSKNRAAVGEKGTRHSAAIGLTELSDAIVVVVSEESGEISIAREGKLRTNITSIELQGVLTAFLTGGGTQAAKLSLRRALTARAGLKVGSVLVACVAWLAVVYQPGKVLRSIEIPVEYRGIQPDLVLEKINPDKITATFLGLAGNINLLDPSRVRLIVELGDLAEGEHRVQLGPGSINHPANVSVFDFEPESLRVTILKFEQAELNVQARIRGAPAEGFRLKSVDVNPKIIRAMVLSPYEADKVKIYTQPIDIQGLKTSRSFDAKVEIPNHIKIQDASLLDVTVSVRIEPAS
jgi:diadenylate cyclase